MTYVECTRITASNKASDDVTN